MTTSLILSPAELSYLYTSLSLPELRAKPGAYQQPTGPIRPDSRTPTQFRPLIAEIDILPSCFGSARVIIGGGEGGECIVGIKAEVEKSPYLEGRKLTEVENETYSESWKSWVEINVDTQGLRDDDALNVTIAAIVSEALWNCEGHGIGNDCLLHKLRINDRFHWKLYIDILLIIPPTVTPLSSHPLTLTSLSTYLALLTTSLPLQTSEGNEDPIFSDDWDQATPLYPRTSHRRPPISLLAMSVGGNVFIDPSREELSVAEGVWCVSVDCSTLTTEAKGKNKRRNAKILAIRTLESFSSATIPVFEGTGVSVGGGRGTNGVSGIPPGIVGGRGGTNVGTLKKVVKMVGIVTEEVWEALEGIVERERRKT